MGNYASSHSTYSAVVEPIPVQTTAKAKVSMAITYSVSVVTTLIKSSLVELFEDIITSYSGASTVLSEIEESWYEDMMDKIDRRCAQLQEDAHESVMAVIDADVSTFLGPRDTIVQVISSHPSKHKRHVDDDCCSCTTDATDVLSDDEVTYTSDSDDFNDDESDGEEDDDVVDLETQVDQLLCLSPSCPSSSPLVYVEDYLCPCGECPQYKRIVNDVQTTMPYLSSQQQTSVIRVLQAYSTHNEVIGYLPEMLATAEECLYVWSGDENQALTSLVMLYDEIPQLVRDDYPQWVV